MEISIAYWPFFDSRTEEQRGGERLLGFGRKWGTLPSHLTSVPENLLELQEPDPWSFNGAWHAMLQQLIVPVDHLTPRSSFIDRRKHTDALRTGLPNFGTGSGGSDPLGEYINVK